MRIRISHTTSYRYDTPPTSVTQLLRLTPRHHDGQYVMDWRVDLSADCQLHQHEDAFGNITHSFTAEGPLDALAVSVEGEVDTQETHGVVRGTLERFPPALYLRETALTMPDSALIDFANTVRANAVTDDPLALMHALLGAVHREMAFDTDPTHAATTAAEAFSLQRGVCQDLTHVYIAAARHLGMPARYVSGHLWRADGVTAQEAGHAWAEVHVDKLGWVGFDPANGISTTEAHVRVAVGLDYLGAAPVRGSRHGGGGESMKVAVQVAQARQQAQT
ncbi:MAG TPA: transglutaminase family protein [Pseudolabrys sp.]|nr:transglutaminase family protein [Pseudolabrys sp.]